MAMTDVRMPMRDATKRATIVVHLHRPIAHRLLWRVGVALMRVGAWIAGFAGVTVEGDD